MITYFRMFEAVKQLFEKVIFVEVAYGFFRNMKVMLLHLNELGYTFLIWFSLNYMCWVQYGENAIELAEIFACKYLQKTIDASKHFVFTRRVYYF